MLRLALGGHEGKGPMGLKTMATWLNQHGYRTRQGGLWGIGSLHQMLINPVYGGRWRFNRTEGRTRRQKSASEQIFADAPAIIPPEMLPTCRTC
jgi:site-specific DNA recombinase